MIDLDKVLEEIENKLRQELVSSMLDDALMVGIHTGGYYLAKVLHRRLQLPLPLAGLNITFYRDDFSRIGIHPQVIPSEMPVSIEDRTVILVDDVLYTGRTVRAAMNEIFDYGRPARIILVVLVARDRRELPIQADIVGMNVQLEADEYIRLQDEPLKLIRIRSTT